MTSADIAIIGGSGLEQAFSELEERVAVDTPYGSTSVAIGVLAGRRVAFLPRHGATHATPPHLIPARTNAWALASLGVTAIVSTAAVGSLSDAMPPGSFAVADQLLDRTRSRAGTFFDEGSVQHLPFADPFCPVLSSVARAAFPDASPAATVAVIEGPRFSTRAESRELRAAGADLVNMTLCPEVALAAELGIGTTTVCFVTDTDAAFKVGDPEAVTADLVFARLAAALPALIAGVERIVAGIPSDYPGRRLLSDTAIGEALARPTISATVGIP